MFPNQCDSHLYLIKIFLGEGRVGEGTVSQTMPGDQPEPKRCPRMDVGGVTPESTENWPHIDNLLNFSDQEELGQEKAKNKQSNAYGRRVEGKYPGEHSDFMEIRISTGVLKLKEI